ncbi:MAG: aldo/keto reductase [Desulfovibrionaceae bacterium]
MRTKNLGNTSLTSSVIGFGTWGLGGVSYGPIEEEHAITLLHMALERGVTLYDTSDLYGDGKSEALLAKAFAGKRDRILIATKGGTLPHTGFHMPQDFSRRHLESALEASLKRLGTDYVDLYQLHSPTLEDIEVNDCVATLEAMRAAGKIKAFGVSVRSPMDGKVAIEKYGFRSVQVNFNLIDQRAAECGLFDAALAHEAGLICRTPLCFGFLSGSLGADTPFTEGDHRANWPKEQLACWADAPSLFKGLTEGKGRSYVQLALQFCLAQPAISTVIPGMMRESEIEEDLAAEALPPLSAAELAEIQAIYKANTFYDKSAKARGKQ